ncbi:hypothetical protein THASP1DRAFT_33613 [Thamnocephalis sphaerospora]|uniref:Uncharacterized protein n=1 Tax=Thamnocephalis sphaerospora TaxID=78915 RepID=A0A4P9XH69_9FUNG|nr:hypothetical protein THASP1DRAFT_33613 [Thamnocephalis sphaerospora]|eukprot:RKP04601.1 hypothetical protein THASP1DRAFT_33613 [Thamnocephalis sphaerospora]
MASPAKHLETAGIVQDRRGRWMIVGQTVYNLGHIVTGYVPEDKRDELVSYRLTLPDMNDEFPPCSLTLSDILDPSDFKLWSGNGGCAVWVRVLSARHALNKHDYGIIVMDIFKKPSASKPLKPATGPGARDGLSAFQHGWETNESESACLGLLHHRAIVVKKEHCSRATVPSIDDGSVITSYDLPVCTIFKHVLGDLALFIGDDGENLALYDAFTGVKIRAIYEGIRCGDIYANIGSPVYLFGWSKKWVRRAKEEECERLSLPPPSKKKSFARRLRWYDFMPKISKQDKRHRRTTLLP